MNNEQNIRDKLRKIEALVAGGATQSEREAAVAAAERIRRRLKDAEPNTTHLPIVPESFRLDMEILAAYVERCRNRSGKPPKS